MKLRLQSYIEYNKILIILHKSNISRNKCYKSMTLNSEGDKCDKKN